MDTSPPPPISQFRLISSTTRLQHPHAIDPSISSSSIDFSLPLRTKSSEMEAEGGSVATPTAPPATNQTPNNRQTTKRVKKHATVYQKNALYGAYRFWRKKNEDLRARGIDVGFEWKELFEFFGFAKTTGFKVIKDADQDPSTLLRRDETGKVETRGRKPKMSEDQIQAVERMLEGQDPFAEGIEWKVIAKQLDLDVHKHTVRRTIRRTLQSRRKSMGGTPSKPTNNNTVTPSGVTASGTTANITANINPNLAAATMTPTPTHHPPAPLAPPMHTNADLHHHAMPPVPANVDPRIMAMSAQVPHPGRPNFSEAEMARILANAS